jgi:inner membrane protein
MQEEFQQEEMSPERQSKTRILVKSGIIVLIIALLMLPAYRIENLVAEREARQTEAVTEVSGKWADRQMLGGPMLVLPYTIGTTKHYAYFLPANLKVEAQVDPQERHRGIYKVMLYSAQVKLSGSFAAPDFAALHIEPAQVLWNEVFVRLRLSDAQGLNEELALNWNGHQLLFAPNTVNDPYSEGSLASPLPISGVTDLAGANFSGVMRINGSQQLLFAPVGKTTTVELQSSWPHPSFTGEGLPQKTSIRKDGFSASWRSLAHRRSFPLQFTDGERPDVRSYNLDEGAFGVDLYIPVSAYQKTLRSVKYALLCIVLTFAAFFLIEIVNKRSVHPFQYGLIGLALVLFYALLLSFSEYIGFNPAYAVASVATIGLIAWFVRGLLHSGRLTTLLSAVLVLLYGYVFTILQLQDFALLLGSIGLFLTLAVIMYFSRKINW